MAKEIPKEVQDWYWKKVQQVTLLALALWILIAMVLPVLSPLFKGVSLGSLPPLHWYINAFIVIVLGIVLIFWYAAKMNQLDQELQRRIQERR